MKTFYNTDSEKNYIQHELYSVCPLPLIPENKNGIIRIQLSSEHGKTKHLNITGEQFKAIEQILIGGNNE